MVFVQDRFGPYHTLSPVELAAMADINICNAAAAAAGKTSGRTKNAIILRTSEKEGFSDDVQLHAKALIIELGSIGWEIYHVIHLEKPDDESKTWVKEHVPEWMQGLVYYSMCEIPMARDANNTPLVSQPLCALTKLLPSGPTSSRTFTRITKLPSPGSTKSTDLLIAPMFSRRISDTLGGGTNSSHPSTLIMPTTPPHTPTAGTCPPTQTLRPLNW